MNKVIWVRPLNSDILQSGLTVRKYNDMKQQITPLEMYLVKIQHLSAGRHHVNTSKTFTTWNINECNIKRKIKRH